MKKVSFNALILYQPSKKRSICCVARSCNFSMNAALFRRLACRPAAFLAVRRGQPEGEPSLLNFKLHTARVRVCVGLTALAGVGCGIGGQPVLEVGVVGADMGKAIRYVQIKRNLKILHKIS